MSQRSIVSGQNPWTSTKSSPSPLLSVDKTPALCQMHLQPVLLRLVLDFGGAGVWSSSSAPPPFCGLSPTATKCSANITKKGLDWKQIHLN